MIALPYWETKTKNLVKYSLIDEESFSIVGFFYALGMSGAFLGKVLYKIIRFFISIFFK